MLRPKAKRTSPHPHSRLGLIMDELLRTNDPVLLSFIQALLTESGIRFAIADQNMSIIEGSLGVIPRRCLIPRDDIPRARRLLTEAGLSAELPAARKE